MSTSSNPSGPAIVLAFSGGLDTSFCVPYLKERGYAVHTVFADTGGVSAEEREYIEQRAHELGVASHRTVDAAQAMTYNEWAQVLETVNPETGELYTEDDFDVVSYADTVGAMLQDAIWARTADLQDEAFAARTVEFLKAVIKGWVYTRDNPEEGAAITYAVATSAEAAFPAW